jgi:hypothetical protein
MSENRYIGLEDLERINNENKQNQKNDRKNKNKGKRISVFDRLTTKENIIIFSFLLIFLLIASALIAHYNPFSTIDYRKVNSEYFLSDSTEVIDRDVYWILNDIILNVLHSGNYTSSSLSANGEGTESDLYYKYSAEEYYNVLNSDYKKYLSKKKYLELLNNVISNYNENYESLVGATSEAPIRKVYQYSKLNGDYYIVRLSTSNESYIGIQLFRESSQFSIFYLE